MKACVSGQSGVVVIKDSEEWYVQRPTNGSPVPIRPGSAARLLDGSTDIIEIDPSRAAFELERQQAKDTAFHYLLTLLDEDVIGQIELRLLGRLKHFLSLPEVSEHILNRLYAAPLNESSRRHAKLLIAHDGKHPVAQLLQRIIAAQASIGDVRSAWETVSTGQFRSPIESDEYFLAAVDTGLVRKLVLHLRGEETTNLLPEDQIVRAWMEIAKDSWYPRTPHSPMGQPSVNRKSRGTSSLFDANYLQALARRDPEAENFLVAHFSRPVELNLRGRLRSNDLVQDAKQETFLRILRYFHSGKTLDNPAALPGFVFAVCHNVVLEFQRSGIRHLDLETAPKTVDSAELLVRAAASREYGVDRSYLRVLFQRALNRFRTAMAQAKGL